MEKVDYQRNIFTKYVSKNEQEAEQTMLPLSYNLHVPSKFQWEELGPFHLSNPCWERCWVFGGVVWGFYFALVFKGGKIRSATLVSCFQGHLHRRNSWNDLKPKIKCYLSTGSICWALCEFPSMMSISIQLLICAHRPIRTLGNSSLSSPQQHLA